MPDIRTEIFTGEAWEDISGDVYERDAVQITRGVPDQGTSADPSSLTLTLNNRGGRYSARYAGSPLYGKIGRNTPIRVSVPSADGESYLDMDGAPYSASTGTDVKTATSLIDVQWEGQGHWGSKTPTMLIGKWGAQPGRRSWHMRLDDGQLGAYWSFDGTAGWQVFLGLPNDIPERAAFRMTFTPGDANGTSYWNWFWAPSLDGPWQRFGPVDYARTVGPPYDHATPVFWTDEPITIAPEQTVDNSRLPLRGRCYRARVVYDNVVAYEVDFRDAPEGANSVSGWTVNSGVRARDDRFAGEVSEWPLRWEPHGDVWTPIRASGILRRMGMGSKALASPLRRRIASDQFKPLAYWPLEEGEAASQAYSPVNGVAPMTASSVDWAADTSLLSSDPLPVLQPATGEPCVMTGVVPAPGGALSAWGVQWLFHKDEANPGLVTVMRIKSTGTIAEWRILAGAPGYQVIGLNAEGTQTYTGTWFNWSSFNGGVGPYGKDWYKAEFWLTQTATNTTRWHLGWVDLNGVGVAPEADVAGKIGRPTVVGSNDGGFANELAGMAMGHISVWPSADTAAYESAITGWANETALNRVKRIGQEEGLPLYFVNDDSDSQRMGYQPITPVLDILADAAAADGSLLTEVPDQLALLFRKRANMYSQEPRLTLSTQSPGLGADIEPTDDDSGVVNDVTVSRTGGSSARAVLESGALSALDPPAGIGRYDSETTLNLFSDSQCEPQAYWLLHLGTYDAPRYPRLTLMLHKPGALAALGSGVSALREGDLIRVTDLPPWVASGPVDLLVRGWTESIDSTTWTFELNCDPGAPWRVGITDSAEYGLVDTDGSQLAADVAPADTQILVSGPAWVRETPLSITAGGEQMAVSAVAPLADMFSRTTANGWGASPWGESWVTAAGTASAFSTNGTTGQVAVATLDTFYTQRLADNEYSDVDLTATVVLPVLPVGNPAYVYVCARTSGDASSNMVLARLIYNPGGTAQLSLRQRVGGAEDVLATQSGTIAATAGQSLSIRFRAVGDAVSAKVWASGSAEPDSWTVSASSAWPFPGFIALRAYVAPGVTNGLPFIVRWGDLTFGNVQRFTVTRSLGLALPAGADVAAVNPARAAL